MTPEERDRLTRVEERTKTLGDDVSEIKHDMKEVLAAIQAAKGGWKMIAVGLSIATVLGAIFDWAVRMYLTVRH